MAPPAKRKRAQQPVEEHDSDSDSDAPEEFSNAASKQQAIDSARAARAASRQSRQGKKAASSAGAAAEDGDGKPGGQEENMRGTYLSRETDEADQEDLLPLDVIQQLAEKHRQGDGAHGLDEQPEGSQQQQQQQKAKHKQKQRLLEVDRGPVHVKVLRQNPAPKASESAASFRAQRLLGSKQRSVTMLAPPGAYHVTPAPKFAAL